MSNYEKLSNALGELEDLWNEYQKGRQAQDEVIDAARVRIREDRMRDAERLQTLEARLAAAGTTATARRLATVEIAELKERTYQPSEQERAMFDEAYESTLTTLEDFRGLQIQAKELLGATEVDVKSMRNQIYAHDSQLMARWIEGQPGKFDRVAGG